MSTHSPLSASSMQRWVNCPGSVKLSTGLESVSSAAAEEGTKAHEEAVRILREGEKSSNPDVLFYTEFLKDEKAQENYYEFGLEVPIRAPDMHKDFYGTADCVMWLPHVLRIYDFKYGKKTVQAERNLQLQYYILGALESNKPWAVKRFEAVIVQPRSTTKEKVRRWSFGYEELWEFAILFLNAAKKTEEDNPKLSVGEWCFFCPARQICPEHKNKKQKAAYEEFAEWVSE